MSLLIHHGATCYFYWNFYFRNTNDRLDLHTIENIKQILHARLIRLMLHGNNHDLLHNQSVIIVGLYSVVNY